MNLSSLGSGVRHDLEAAGWQPTRAVDTRDAETAIEAFGCTVSTHAREFLRAFQGLALMTVNGPCVFDARAALDLLEPSDAPYINRILGESLCPVGYRGRSLFFVSESGKTVLLHDEWVGYVSLPDIGSALNLIVRFDAYSDLSADNWHYFSDDEVPPGCV